MVFINMKMPDACCECPVNFWNSCGILEHTKGKTLGRIEHPSTERLPDCPLIPLNKLVADLQKVGEK